MNQEKTQAQITAAAIMNMPLHPSYVPVEDIPLPLQYGVVVKPLPKPTIEMIPILGANGEESTLYGVTGENTQSTCEGIIYSVGPLCSPYLRVGLRCQYSAEVKTSFEHKRVTYMKMDEFSVWFIMPDPTTKVNHGVKTDKQMGREKRQERQKKVFAAEYTRDQNDKDKSEQLKKRKK